MSAGSVATNDRRELELPRFKYHPDPVATGSVERSNQVCRCCGRIRGYIYTEGALFESDPEGPLCPWCVASGKAHERFGAEFINPAAVGGYDRWDQVPAEVILEVAYRTPAFSGWQEERWWTHCRDAAEFLGPAGRQEVEAYGPALQAALQREAEMTDVEWARRMSLLQKEEHGPTAYVFRCRHCGTLGGYTDALE